MVSRFEQDTQSSDFDGSGSRGAQTNGLPPKSNDPDSQDILVVGARPSSFNYWAVDAVGWPTYGQIADWVAEKFRTIIVQRTDINVDDSFNQHQKDIIKEVIAKISTSKEFKDAFDHQKTQDLKINIIDVHSPSNINGDLGHTDGKQQNGSVTDGSTLTIKITDIYGGSPISDKDFATIVLHEYIHTLGNHNWDARLDAPDSDWDNNLYSTLFSDQFSQASGPATADLTDVAFSTQGGGLVMGAADHQVLVGSVSADDFHPSNGSSIIFSGSGDDTVVLALGGGFDTIVEDGGSDALVLPSGTSLSTIATSWSPDGKDLSLWVSGNLEAVMIDQSMTNHAVEWLRIDNVDYSIASLGTAVNSTPQGTPDTIEVVGTFQGLIGNATAVDAENDTIHYRLAALDGAYEDQNWTVTDDGKIYANFMRYDQPGSEFTLLTVTATDGVSSSDFDINVRWGSASDPGPVLGRMPTPDEHASAFSMMSAQHDQAIQVPMDVIA